jgi:F0F1-type ATP synthase beta subunit
MQFTTDTEATDCYQHVLVARPENTDLTYYVVRYTGEDAARCVVADQTQKHVAGSHIKYSKNCASVPDAKVAAAQWHNAHVSVKPTL